MSLPRLPSFVMKKESSGWAMFSSISPIACAENSTRTSALFSKKEFAKGVFSQYERICFFCLFCPSNKRIKNVEP